MKKWKTVNTKTLCSSDFLSVTEDTVILPNGKQIDYNTIKLHDFVSVIPIIENSIVMIEILRYPRNCTSLEIPSGHIEKNETPQESATRELLEETGYTAGQLTPLGSFHPLSRSLQTAHLFLATKLTKGTQQLEETEQINLKHVPLQEIPTLLNTGKIVHAPTIIGLQRLLLMKQKPNNS
ncbi:MAG: NUDIX hydrolase [Candidatus Bathyarchaeota archaeon]|nr:MAG: NUDIX hydrolase [Candidatus Bathyarchaeota archaeon]